MYVEFEPEWTNFGPVDMVGHVSTVQVSDTKLRKRLRLAKKSCTGDSLLQRGSGLIRTALVLTVHGDPFGDIRISVRRVRSLSIGSVAE